MEGLQIAKIKLDSKNVAVLVTTYQKQVYTNLQSAVDFF
jgi:hypothetical protein